MTIYLLRHLQVLFDTLGRLARAPLPSLITIAVLAVAIALPVLLYKISLSLQQAVGDWRGDYPITLFLQADSEAEAIEFGQRLLQIPTIRDVAYISKQEALTEFKTLSGFGDLLDGLTENPLPALLIVYPQPNLATANASDALPALIAQLQAMPAVDMLNYDGDWRARLSAIIALCERVVLLLAGFMATGVVLIISNTVRLGVLSRADEIHVIEQIGGTAAFIRRPFLYAGVIHALLGGLLALVFANIAIFLLARPLHHLAELYQSNIRLSATELRLCASVLVAASGLGWLAARLTAGNQVRKLRANAPER